MPVLGGEMRTRVQAFDTIIEKNARALEDPRVVEVLGAYVTTLSRINQELFLPNIRGTTIQLPKRHQSDSHAALLPLVPEDTSHGLRYTLEMLLPGEELLDRTAKRIAAGPLGISEADAYHSAVAATMSMRTNGAQQLLDSHLREVADTRARGLFPTSATIGNSVAMLDEQDILYSRQLVVVPSELARYSVPAVASIGLHEELHVEDHNTMRFEDLSDPDYRYRKELRGIHIGALILECMDDQLLDSDQVVIEATMFVEALRRLSKEGTDEPPFSSNAAIISHFARYDTA